MRMKKEKRNEKGRGSVSNSNDDALARGLYCYRTHARIESTKQEKQMSEGPLFSLAHLRLRMNHTPKFFRNHITTNIIKLEKTFFSIIAEDCIVVFVLVQEKKAI